MIGRTLGNEYFVFVFCSFVYLCICVFVYLCILYLCILCICVFEKKPVGGGHFVDGVGMAQGEKLHPSWINNVQLGGLIGVIDVGELALDICIFSLGRAFTSKGEGGGENVKSY